MFLATILNPTLKLKNNFNSFLIQFLHFHSSLFIYDNQVSREKKGNKKN